MLLLFYTRIYLLYIVRHTSNLSARRMYSSSNENETNACMYDVCIWYISMYMYIQEHVKRTKGINMLLDCVAKT